MMYTNRQLTRIILALAIFQSISLSQERWHESNLKGMDQLKIEINIDGLENAIDAHLRGSIISVPVTNPIGWNIKWDGKDAHWMPPAACDLI